MVGTTEMSPDHLVVHTGTVLHHDNRTDLLQHHSGYLWTIDRSNCSLSAVLRLLYSSSNAGYRLAKELKSMTPEEREKEIELVEHSLNDCKSRTKQLNKQKRKYIAYIKKAQEIMLEENQNHIPKID